MAFVPKVAISSSASVATSVRPVAGARNVASSDGGAVRALIGIDPTGSEATGFPFWASRPEVGEREERRPPPSLFSRFSATAPSLTAALNIQRAVDDEGQGDRQRRPGVRPSPGQSSRAVSLYELTSRFLTGEQPARGRSVNLTF